MKNTTFYILLASFGAIFLVSFALLTSSQVKTEFQSWFYKNQKQRKILSVLTGDIFRSGELFKVIKLLENNKIYLEVYKTSIEKTELLHKIQLNFNKDGHFYFKRQSTNLALEDLDKDGHLEILAPLYDETHSPRLEVYKLNRKTLQLEPAKKDFNFVGTR